jgi:hypothetical protein
VILLGVLQIALTLRDQIRGDLTSSPASQTVSLEE